MTVAWAVLAVSAAHAEAPPPAAPTYVSSIYVVRSDHWSEGDERDYSRFIAAIGDSGCGTVDKCLHSTANPFHASDPEGIYFRSDCADLAYNLRFYFAWKRGLPFGYVSQVSMRGRGRDFRYGFSGNAVAERTTVPSGALSGYEIWDEIRDNVSSGTFRIHPTLEEPEDPDLYSPAIDVKSIRPGTVIYDPNGHLAIVYRVDPDGRIHYLDAHPDNAMTRGFYDLRFARAPPGMGAGFKNWRPVTLVGATRQKDGTLSGGHVVLPINTAIPDFSDEQFFGNGKRTGDDSDWVNATFTLDGTVYDYYDYVRARLAGGKLEFDPVKEVHDMVASNCADLHYRVDAVKLAIAAGLMKAPQPSNLPPNIYGTEGDWEIYSTPSRDARLKTAFKELRDAVERFMTMYEVGDFKLKYAGKNLAVDMLTAYDREAAACKITYAKSDGTTVSFGYEEGRRRLFAMSFDPYHCIERRWGASDARELASCNDGPAKQAWYLAEQNLRNQLDRTYDVPMDFTLTDLRDHVAGSGVPAPPDIDVRTYLWTMRNVVRGDKRASN